MTPNKPETAKAAREMISMTNSALENNVLILIGRLADTITYNAEAMNKLVRRVDELEKLVVQKSASETPEEGEYLEVLLKRGVNKVRCVKVESNAYTLNKVYVVEQRVEARHKFVRNENGIECGMSASRFVEVKEQGEHFKQMFKLDCTGNPHNANFKDDAEHFLAVSRIFMGLPTIHLIHPRSL